MGKVGDAAAPHAVVRSKCSIARRGAMTAGWGASYPDHWPSPIPIPKPNPNQLRRLLGCLGFASRLDTSPYADLLSEELWGRAAKSFETESLALLGEAKESPLRLCVEAGAPRRPAIVSRATVSRAIVSRATVSTKVVEP